MLLRVVRPLAAAVGAHWGSAAPLRLLSSRMDARLASSAVARLAPRGAAILRLDAPQEASSLPDALRAIMEAPAETDPAVLAEVDAKLTPGRVYHEIGRRKEATARVWISLGTGKVTVNHQPLYFSRMMHRDQILLPFYVTCTMGQFDVRVLVGGGGKSGQAGAIRLGVARALESFESRFRPILAHAGLLTRDDRMVEPKKPGHVKARKQQQWNLR